MKYRLSLDVGVSSIGSAVVSLNDKNESMEIKDCGCCIFPVSEGAEDRRTKRGQRKNIARRKLRIKLLTEALREAGLWPNEDSSIGKLLQLNPYAIRAQAVHGKLNSIEELGRAILHLAKHRGAGFVEMQKIENEKAQEAESEQGGRRKKTKLSEYAVLTHRLKDSEAETIGEYFYMRLSEAYRHNNINDSNRRLVRQKTKTVVEPVDYAIPRYLVKEEFDRIWEKQSEYYPCLKDEDTRDKIKGILFYEKHHRPYATGKCIFIGSEERLTKAHPLSERRRIYEAVNNIRLESSGTKRKLTIEERDLIINELLMKGQKAGKMSVKKLLEFKGTVIIADMIQPYLFSKEAFKIDALQNLSEEKLCGVMEFIASPFVEGSKDYLYNDEELVNKLMDELKADEKTVTEIIALTPTGRGSLGITATKAILEHLEREVITIREVTDRLAEYDERYTSEEETARMMQGSLEKLPYYGQILRTDTQPIADWLQKQNKSLNDEEKRFGKIANPAVHMVLNQIRRVVNDIIRIYGKPYDINIELAREVGKSKEGREEIIKQQKQNQKANDEAAEFLRENGVRVTRTNILKYKLALEQNWQDAFGLYCDGKDSNSHQEIPHNFEGFEIEHLIPESCGGTDAPVNRVLISRRANLNKGKMYPYEYLHKIYAERPEHLERVIKNVRNNTNMSEGKKWRFYSDAREHFESGLEGGDDPSRYLTDTRYISKLAARYLKSIVDYEEGDEMKTRVLTINGSHTSRLRRFWNLDGIEYDLLGVKVPRYVNRETGVVYDDEFSPDAPEDGHHSRNPEYKAKPRIDHRHHIVDAIAIACINRSNVQAMGRADNQGLVCKENFPVPFAGNLEEKQALQEFRNTVLAKLRDVSIYYKPDRSSAGQLHKETKNRIVRTNSDGSVLLKKSVTLMDPMKIKKSADLSKLLIDERIADGDTAIQADIEAMKRLKEQIESLAGKAKERLEAENEKLLAEDKKPRAVSEQRILMEAMKLALAEGPWTQNRRPSYENKKSLIVIDKHEGAYDSGNNFAMQFYEDSKGKVGWECVNRFNANNPAFTPEWKEKGFKAIWQLQNGDTIELDTPEQWQKYTSRQRCRAKIKKMSNGALFVTYEYDARADVDGQDFLKGGLSFYTQNNARKVELTPFGKVARKHKKLWHGAKA